MFAIVQETMDWSNAQCYNQVLAFTKKLGLCLTYIVCLAHTKLFMKANTCNNVGFIITSYLLSIIDQCSKYIQ